MRRRRWRGRCQRSTKYYGKRFGFLDRQSRGRGKSYRRRLSGLRQQNFRIQHRKRQLRRRSIRFRRGGADEHESHVVVRRQLHKGPRLLCAESEWQRSIRANHCRCTFWSRAMIASKKVIALLACFGAATSIGFSSLSDGQALARQHLRAPPHESFVSDEVLVKFNSNVTRQARLDAMSSVGDRPMRMSVGSRGLALVKLPPGRSVEDAMNGYRAMADVEAVQPNYIYKKLASPNDPNYAQMWGLHNTGQVVAGGGFPTARIPGADIGAEEAWDINGGDCSSIVVAVVDSGVNYTHADLVANMWDGSGSGFPNHGRNFVFGEDPNDPLPADADGHGTHVAATIGAVGNNGIGATGVCWQVKLMALPALTASGGTSASVFSRLSFAIDNGAKVE